MNAEANEICPLCGRPLVPGPSVNKHHIVPRSRGGKEAHDIHRVCHDKIHALFTERELARTYNTFELLREHPDIQTFIRWIRRKPPEYHTGHRQARRKKR